MASEHVKRLLAARERWMPLDDSREVRFARPSLLAYELMLMKPDADRIPDIAACVVGWRGAGFTEAGILGASMGGDATVPFDPVLWREMLMDRPDWFARLAEEVATSVRAFRDSVQDAEKK